MIEGGRIVIPARFRKALGLKEGDSVNVELVDSSLRVTTRAEDIRQAIKLAAPYRTGRPMAEELLAERRAEDD